MRMPVIMGCGLLLAAVLVGCGSSSEDAVAKERIAVLDQMSGILEKVTDAKSFKDAEAQMAKLKTKAEDLAAKSNKWSESTKKAMETKYKAQIEASMERMQKAMMTASTKALGGGFPDLKLPVLK